MLVPMTGYMTNSENAPVLGEEALNFNSANSWNSRATMGPILSSPYTQWLYANSFTKWRSGSGSVANVTNFGIIDSPTVNWVATDDIDGSTHMVQLLVTFLPVLYLLQQLLKDVAKVNCLLL